MQTTTNSSYRPTSRAIYCYIATPSFTSCCSYRYSILPKWIRRTQTSTLKRFASGLYPCQLFTFTDLINLLLAGSVPTSVRGAIFGASLLAIAEKFGGIRPIAVGYVWRRLAAKVACSHVKDASAAILTPDSSSLVSEMVQRQQCVQLDVIWRKWTVVRCL